MKEIIWIFGSSAAGKETFLNQIKHNEENTILLNKIKILKNKFKILQESIDFIGEYDNDSKQELRLNFKENISKELNKNKEIDTILIKGQDYDLENKTPQKIKQIFQNYTHKIIFLHCEFEILYQRVKNKSWWTKELEKKGINYFKDWLIKEQLPELIKLNEKYNFEIITIDSSTKEYKITQFPKHLIK